MNVSVELKETSQALTYTGVINTYTKGPFYCVYSGLTHDVHKFPLDNIWRVTEDYRGGTS